MYILKRIPLSLFFIFLLALLLRLYNLQFTPFASHKDEISNAYIGRFILLNGEDLNGIKWPLLYSDKFGDYPPVIPMYLSGLSTIIFGLNQFAIRIPTAIIGSLLIFAFYGFLRLLYPKEKKVSEILLLLMAVLPWHLVLSRASSEGIIGLSAYAFGLLALLHFIKNNNIRCYYFAFILFLLSYLLYPSFRIIVPLTCLPIPFFTGPQFKIRKIVLFIFFIGFSMIIGTTTWGKGRYEQTSLLSSIDVKQNISSKNTAFHYDEGPSNIFIARIFHNKLTGYARLFIQNYTDYFSPVFLFSNSGLPARYTVPESGILFYGFIILFILIIILPEKININRKLYFFFFYLLIISPIPAALTVDDIPNIHRSIMLMIPLLIIASVGYYKALLFFKNKYKKIFQILFLCIISIEFIFFMHNYYFHTTSYKSILRNDGNKELAQYLINNHQSYNKILVSNIGWMTIYYLFYNNNFSSDLVGKFTNHFQINQIDNIIFSLETCPVDALTEISGYSQIIQDGDCKVDKEKFEIEKIIFRKDSTKAFQILKPKLN